jgi:fructosamine-3-kinase
VDLAMLQLFGNPGRAFFAAYHERAPLSPGWEERVALYQLFPLLVHAALFGGGYAASAERAARVYV